MSGWILSQWPGCRLGYSRPLRAKRHGSCVRPDHRVVMAVGPENAAYGLRPRSQGAHAARPREHRPPPSARRLQTQRQAAEHQGWRSHREVHGEASACGARSELTALGGNSPAGRCVATDGELVSTPILGGLHHRYTRVASTPRRGRGLDCSSAEPARMPAVSF